jgi:hypothetical protein
LKTNRSIASNYSNRFRLNCSNRLKSPKLSGLQKSSSDYFFQTETVIRSERPKLFFKKNGKLYSSLKPSFFKTFSINNKQSNLKINNLLDRTLVNWREEKLTQTLLIKSSNIMQNEFKKLNNLESQLTFVKFVHPDKDDEKLTKSVGLYSITEDFFEQDVNSVFCRNSEFIENGETLGLLNLEKEITGDIVQGLPRIEEILEARKKKSS